MAKFQAKRVNNGLKGQVVDLPADKSISHRSIIFLSLANGVAQISNLLEGEDVLATIGAMKKMGVEIEKLANGNWQIKGSGLAGLVEPSDVLDMGNSGTACRLLMGLVASFDFKTIFCGDVSLSKRPMQRVIDPIQQFGAEILAASGGRLPLTVIGDDENIGIEYDMKIASAQIKSCILLAGLNAYGQTKIIENSPCRDHSELMMKYLGIDLKIDQRDDGGKIISFIGNQEFDAKNIDVVGDISSAAFLIVAALIIKDSDILIQNVGMNILRDGVITSLLEMGADIKLLNPREVCGEKCADIKVKYSNLKAIETDEKRAPLMIDEYPILFIAATQADGISKFNGLKELRVKESDRLAAMEDGLKKCGFNVKCGDDYLEIVGKSSNFDGDAQIAVNHDHRIAMSFVVLAMVFDGNIFIDDDSMIKTSFPNFFDIWRQIGFDF